MGANVVEEVTVVGNDDDRSLIVHQKLLQPGDGGKVEVVGRLVQQDDLRLAKQRLRQQDLDLVLVRQGTHLLIQQVLIKAQTFEQLADLGFNLPAAKLGKLRFQRGGKLAVLVGEIFLIIEGVLLLHDLIQARVSLDDGVQHRKAVVGKVVLL